MILTEEENKARKWWAQSLSSDDRLSMIAKYFREHWNGSIGQMLEIWRKETDQELKRFPPMDYKTLKALTYGKRIIRVRDGKEIDRTTFFFETTEKQRLEVLDGDRTLYELSDKFGFRDGVMLTEFRKELLNADEG